MKGRIFALLAVVATALTALAVTGQAVAAGTVVAKPGGLADFSIKQAEASPTAVQREAVAGLGAHAVWDDLGTPSSMVRYGGYLSRDVSGDTAADAARSWLATNQEAFGLESLAGLELYSDSKLAFSDAHAVTFRQSFGGLPALDGGLITIGLKGSAASGWDVASASSSLSRESALQGTANLSAAQAYVQAADNVGEATSLLGVSDAKAGQGYTNLVVQGKQDLQRVKLGAYPTAGGAIPAYEVLTLDTQTAWPSAYKVIVDARDGSIISRSNLVDTFTKTPQGESVTEHDFSGSVGPTDGACDTPKGPYTVGPGVRALDGFAAATVPTNDVVLELYKGLPGPGNPPVVHADTLFSPEQFHYEPAGGVPPGDYYILVCDFDNAGTPGDPDTPWEEPRTYTGYLIEDDTPAPPAYTARWKVFPATPPLAAIDQYPWNHPSTDTRKVWCWKAAAGCDEVVGNTASRGPWDQDMRLNVPTFTTRGNNAKTALSWMNDTVPSLPQYMPTSTPNRDYSYPWTNEWNTTHCTIPPNGPTVPTSWDIDASVTNLFAMHNRLHDWSYYLGFTEQNWNSQDYNFGNTPIAQEHDPLLGDAQSGALVGTYDNANMITLPDGVSSVTNMYLWGPEQATFYPPCVDGDYDMGVIGHEFGHMIENRMIGKGANRNGFYAGAMGEAFGDLNGMEYLNENGYVPTGAENPYAAGTYDTGNKQHAIRDFGMNWPSTGAFPEPGVFPQIDPLNFSDVGFDTPGNEVHSDGEIWVAVNFDIRQALAAKYNATYPATDAALLKSCANGLVAPQYCPGNRRWFQLHYDSFLLDPTAPNMLVARNNILAADVLRFGGANQAEIWTAFAKRGFGSGAFSTTPPNSFNGSQTNSDTDPLPDFARPASAGANATVTFNVTAKEGSGTPAARIFVGHFESRVSPVADTDPATNPNPADQGGGINRDATAGFAPGTYEFLVMAPGYGAIRFRDTFTAGQVKTENIQMPVNWASANQGATATGDTAGTGTAAAANLRALIDDTENTTWSTEGTITGTGADNLSVEGKQVTVHLGGTGAKAVKHIQVSAMLNSPNNQRFTALRAFEVWACNGTGGKTCASDADFTKVYTSPANFFPGDSPRPTVATLILRGFDIPTTPATDLRLRVLTSQCTAPNTPYQGQQADPSFTGTTDCNSDVTPTSTWRFVRAAEFQAFTTSPTVNPPAATPPASPPPPPAAPPPPPAGTAAEPAGPAGQAGAASLRRSVGDGEDARGRGSLDQEPPLPCRNGPELDLAARREGSGHRAEPEGRSPHGRRLAGQPRGQQGCGSRTSRPALHGVAHSVDR
jgi:extracellular elastinolytic metalloproteinase